MSIILTCNAGSSNTKLAAFDAKTLERKAHTVTHSAAETTEWICSVGELEITAIGHRVVHGGGKFSAPICVTASVLEKLQSYIPLAPLHQPAALKLIVQTQKLYPKVTQIACFDTAFHRTMPESERWMPLPRALYDGGIKRYGFHGLSYQHIAAELPKVMGEKAQGRIVVAHLGGGSSACAMRNLQSVASTMGFSTLDGLMMSTRCGTLDAGVVLHLLQEKNMSGAEVSDLLYNQSGLKGVSGISGDMRELLASKNTDAQKAIELYCASAAKHIAALIPSIGGLDALIFTGGIGENAAQVREHIVAQLRWIGDFSIHIVPTDEELVIAEACRALVKGKSHAA